MKKLTLLPVLFFAVACSKSNNDTPTGITGKWNADNADEYISQWEFTADGKYYSKLKTGMYEVAPKDSGRFKFDGKQLTTTFIDHYVNSQPVIAYDTVSCRISGNKMTLDNSQQYTKGN